MESRFHGSRSVVPRYSTLSPLPSPRITSTASRSSASRAGRPLMTRTAESPRPIAQIVRLPYISLSVAKSDAMTVGSRVDGFVTSGPTISLCVSLRIRL